MKQGIQEFHRKYVLVPADKAANNVVVVCWLHYINTLKQELNGTKAYEETSKDEKSVVYSHSNKIPKKFAVYVKERQDRLPTMYWLPKLHKRPYKARFIANSSSCTTTELSNLLTSCLTAIKAKVIKYCETVYERSGKNMFWHIKNSGEVLSKLKDIGYQADVIKAFNSTSRYLDDLLNIDNPYFEGMVNQIYPSELQLNKANTSDTEAPFLDLHLSISNGYVSSKIYDKRDDFDFDIVNFPFLDGDVPRRPSYGVYISQLT